MDNAKGLWSTALCPNREQWWVVSLRSPFGNFISDIDNRIECTSASSLMILNWVVLLTQQNEGMPSRETWKNSKTGHTWMNWSSASSSARSPLTWVRAIPDKCRDWEKDSLRAVLWRKAQHELVMCTCISEGQMHPVMNQKQHDQTSLLCPYEAPPGVSSTKSGSKGGHKDDQRVGAPLLQKKAEGSMVAQAGEEKVPGRHHCGLSLYKGGF